MVEKYDESKLNAIYNKLNGLYRIRNKQDTISKYIVNNVDKVEDFIMRYYDKNLPTRKYYYGLLNKFLRECKHENYF